MIREPPSYVLVVCPAGLGPPPSSGAEDGHNVVARRSPARSAISFH